MKGALALHFDACAKFSSLLVLSCFRPQKFATGSEFRCIWFCRLYIPFAATIRARPAPPSGRARRLLRNLNFTPNYTLQNCIAASFRAGACGDREQRASAAGGFGPRGSKEPQLCCNRLCGQLWLRRCESQPAEVSHSEPPPPQGCGSRGSEEPQFCRDILCRLLPV